MLEVTQEDRAQGAGFVHGRVYALSVLRGEADDAPIVQAFAAHRQATERAVVEFVRAKHHPNSGHAFYKVIADAIERGEHRK